MVEQWLWRGVRICHDPCRCPLVRLQHWSCLMTAPAAKVGNSPKRTGRVRDSSLTPFPRNLLFLPALPSANLVARCEMQVLSFPLPCQLRIAYLSIAGAIPKVQVSPCRLTASQASAERLMLFPQEGCTSKGFSLPIHAACTANPCGPGE